ncbi:TspO/MBR family protein [Botrimarina mediterranea]|uniref:TspO/MBR family protein n=1 Tax=Botrimarina mediterranea TaxID=2528022 RepID=UPI003AF32D77
MKDQPSATDDRSSPAAAQSEKHSMPSWLRQVAALAGFLLLCFSAAAVGGMLTASSVGGWYQTLRKPPLSPPDWVFGPVWSALYTLMAIAAWLVWRRSGWQAGIRPLSLFVVQLSLNVAWSGVFFFLRMPGGAFAEITILWLAIAATTWQFWKHSHVAALLMTPYLAWVTFAGYLNFAIWRLNP